MEGLVLAAGLGSRLRPYTDLLPKTLLPVDGDRTILDTILANLAEIGLTRVTVVVGHAADEVGRCRAALSRRYGLAVELVHNPSPAWNNCYSLWLARDIYAKGALVVNGDTLHPVQIEQALLAGSGDLRLAIDTGRELTAEAMKVVIGSDDRIGSITKRVATADAHGEYLGACLVEPSIAPALTDALERTWQTDPTQYYEDAFQLLIDSGADVRAVPVPGLAWVEVDDADDLALAKSIACRR